MTRNLPSTPNQVEIRKRRGFSHKLRPRGNLICLAAVFCKTNLSNNKNKGLKRFTFHGGALSDVILFPWKEEIICQQKAAREKKNNFSGRLRVNRWWWESFQCTAQQFMKRNSCREASCRGDHLNQMAPVPKRIKEEEEGNKKAATPAGTQHQLAIVKLCAHTHLNKGFLAIHWTMEIHIIRKGERKWVTIIVTSSSLAQLHEDFKSLTGRLLEPSSCCFHATSRVEFNSGVRTVRRTRSGGWVATASSNRTNLVSVCLWKLQYVNSFLQGDGGRREGGVSVWDGTPFGSPLSQRWGKKH